MYELPEEYQKIVDSLERGANAYWIHAGIVLLLVWLLTR